MNKDHRVVKSICVILVASIVIGFIPWKQLRADTDIQDSDDSYQIVEESSEISESTDGTLVDETTESVEASITSEQTEESAIASETMTIPSVSVTPMAEATIEPSIYPSATATPTPVDEDDSEEDQYIFPYAIFSGSTSEDVEFNGWKSDITGDIYSGRNFIYQGSELHMNGVTRTHGTIQPSRWTAEMNGAHQNVTALPMPDWSDSVMAKPEVMPTISPETFNSKDSIIANGFYYTDDDITIEGTSFTADAIIVSKGDITYNIDSLKADEEVTGRLLLYSLEGDITINGTTIEFNGMLYAPNGDVKINAYDTTINGRIVADKFSYSGSILNVYSDSSDLQLVQGLPEVVVRASSVSVNVGEYACYSIQIPKDNVYEIRYRLNGNEVQVNNPDSEDDPSIYTLDTSNEGIYVLEAYVVMPYGEFVLDSDTIKVINQITDVPTITPEPDTPTPTETDEKDPEEERYDVISQGEGQICRYRNPYDIEHWILSDNVTIEDDELKLPNKNDVEVTAVYDCARSFSPDYSFSGRYTTATTYGVSGADLTFFITPDKDSINTNSIGIYINPFANTVGFVTDNQWRSIPSENITTAGDFSTLKKYNEVWFDYDGTAHILKIYTASYNALAKVVKPQEPAFTYSIDLSEKFEGCESFFVGFWARNGLFQEGQDTIYGIEFDPYPDIHPDTSYPTDEPTITPESNTFVELSQGNRDYGYETGFVEEDWSIRGEASYVSEDNITLVNAVNTENPGEYGSARLDFLEDVGDDYEFYTRFSFTHQDQLSNGLAFVIEPYNNTDLYWGNMGYNLHQKSVVVEFDHNPQTGYSRLNENGEWEEYEESASHVGIIVNGNEEQHYDVADYRFMSVIGKVTDAWVDYNGKTLSVYVCTVNRYGHIYKYEEPIVSIDIDLNELFDGNTNLYFGFMSKRTSDNSTLVLDGFAIAKEPFRTLLPNELPEDEQDRYQVLSMGDSNYGYRDPFDPEDWNGEHWRITPNVINIASFTSDSNEYYCTIPKEVSEDYSFSGRFTARIAERDLCHYMNFYISSSPENREHAVSIHLDTYRTDAANWRNEFGGNIEGYESGFYENGLEPYEAMVSVCLNHDDRHDLAIAEYLPLRDDGAVHDIWFSYDGTEKLLYVYISTYDESGHVNMPDSPILVCPLDMEEIFGGEHELYIGYYGRTSLFEWGDYKTFGFEFDPRHKLDISFDQALYLLAPLDNRVYQKGDTIDISGRIGDASDPDKLAVISLKDSNGNLVYENRVKITDEFGYIDRIPTDGFDCGSYTIEITVTGKDGQSYVRSIPIVITSEVVISGQINEAVLTENGVDLYGTIDCNEDSTYELLTIDVDSQECTSFVQGSGNKTNEVLGTLDLSSVHDGTNNIKFIINSASGKTFETVFSFDYSSLNNEDLTDEELFVDIDDTQDGNEVTYITDIMGTVKGTQFVSYTFEVFPVNSDESIYSCEYTESVENAKLGTIDPTLLTNGYYLIRVTAKANDQESVKTDEIIVLVTGQAKVGNFSMSFLDLTLPVTGLPVEVYRTYDSRVRTQAGDFGYGWNMSIGGPQISVSTELGNDWVTYEGNQLGVPMYYWTNKHPHEVYIDWGNGSSETFNLVLTPDSSLSPDNWKELSASFENASGTSDTLQILDECTNLVYADNSLYTADLQQFVPQNFLLTRYDGMKYYFNDEFGLYKIEDTYGRTVEITNDGVTYSEGGTITFNRDDQGRITSIADGLGNTVEYTYNESGDLINVLDYARYNTSFSYNDGHYLTNTVADNGKTVAINEYDDSGRLISTTDADGRKIVFDHNVIDRTEVVTNRLGYVTTYLYDERGNVVTVTDALERKTTYEYDENNNKISETRPDGTSFAYTYDNNGNLLTATDSNGRTITSSYGTNGELLTMSAMGVTELSMVYDNHGNLISATDSTGNAQEYVYDNSGNLASVTDSLGTLMNMTYDDKGHIISITNAEGSLTNFSYDEEGRLISRTVTYQGQTLTDTYSYDAANRVTGITYANGNTVTYTYNQAGDVTSSKDSQGRTVNYTYDLYGHLLSIDYPDLTSESFTYDAEGRNLTATDRLGRTATFTYDAVGNVLTKTYANGAKEEYAYDVCDRLITSTNVYGGVTTYGYDYLGRNTTITDPYDNTITYAYNDRGNVASITDALNNTCNFTYDNNGNQTSVKYPNGSTFNNTYDARGRMTSQSDAYNNTTSYSYDNMDRLVSVTDAAGGTWNYEYDTMGNLVSVTDANRNTTTYSYDSNGQLTSVTNAEGNTSTTTYDRYGRVVSTSDFGGTVTEYTYDSIDRVSTTTTAGETTTFTYNDVGNLLTVNDPTGTITYTYNDEGYLSSVTNAKGESIYYTYDEAGLVGSITIDEQRTSYGYDKMGRLTTVTDSEGTTKYTYDANGNRISTEYPNGVVTEYGYNNTNVLISEVIKGSDGNVLASYEYTIGANGERLKCTESGKTVEYSYDELNRLVSEIVTIGTDVTETLYTYDKNSNRVIVSRNGETTNYTYNSLNQVTSAGNNTYDWDAAGNLISQRSNGTVVASYEYDCHNRMVSATVIGVTGEIKESYTYDYLGNRTSKTTDGETTYFTTDLSTGYSQVIKAQTGTETIYYTRGFELISRKVGEEACYYLFDGGMSVRGLTDETGAITDTFVFDAFGNETARTGATDNSYGFQGEEKDVTGLYYLRARYMDPSTGTFTSMDTYVGSLSDPMSLHKYLFANANPVKYCDPSGHYSLVEELCVMGVIGSLSNSILFWIDDSINDENNPSTVDYLSAILGGFISGFIAGMLLPVFSIASLTTIVGVTLLIIAVIIGVAGFTINAFVDVYKEEHHNLPMIMQLLLNFGSTLGDIFMSPIKNILSLGNDLYELGGDVIYAIWN